MLVPKASLSPCNLSVLLICEDPAEADRVRRELAQANAPFSVASAPSLDLAYAELRRRPYDALLLDTGLPGQRALDALHGAQSIALRLPTVVLADRSDTELALRSIESGVQDFLIKHQTGPDALARALMYAAVRHRRVAELVRSRHAYAQGQKDPLTGLLSREAFLRKLQETLVFGERFGDRPAVLLVDLDRFRAVQERLGPMLGARLLQEVARRLTWCVRRTDPSGRLSASRLALLLPHVADPGAVRAVADRIRSAFAEPYEIGPWKPRVTASIGAARFPEHGRSAEALLQSADSAALEAERLGGDRYRRVQGVADPVSSDGAA